MADGLHQGRSSSVRWRRPFPDGSTKNAAGRRQKRNRGGAIDDLGRTVEELMSEVQQAPSGMRKMQTGSMQTQAAKTRSQAKKKNIQTGGWENWAKGMDELECNFNEEEESGWVPAGSTEMRSTGARSMESGAGSTETWAKSSQTGAQSTQTQAARTQSRSKKKPNWAKSNQTWAKAMDELECNLNELPQEKESCWDLGTPIAARWRQKQRFQAGVKAGDLISVLSEVEGTPAGRTEIGSTRTGARSMQTVAGSTQSQAAGTQTRSKKKPTWAKSNQTWAKAMDELECNLNELPQEKESCWDLGTPIAARWKQKQRFQAGVKAGDLISVLSEVEGTPAGRTETGSTRTGARSMQTVAGSTQSQAASTRTWSKKKPNRAKSNQTWAKAMDELECNFNKLPEEEESCWDLGTPIAARWRQKQRFQAGVKAGDLISVLSEVEGTPAGRTETGSTRTGARSMQTVAGSTQSQAASTRTWSKKKPNRAKSNQTWAKAMDELECNFNKLPEEEESCWDLGTPIAARWRQKQRFQAGVKAGDLISVLSEVEGTPAGRTETGSTRTGARSMQTVAGSTQSQAARTQTRSKKKPNRAKSNQTWAKAMDELECNFNEEEESRWVPAGSAEMGSTQTGARRTEIWSVSSQTGAWSTHIQAARRKTHAMKIRYRAKSDQGFQAGVKAGDVMSVLLEVERTGRTEIGSILVEAGSMQTQAAKTRIRTRKKKNRSGGRQRWADQLECNSIELPEEEKEEGEKEEELGWDLGNSSAAGRRLKRRIRARVTEGKAVDLLLLLLCKYLQGIWI
ncbi:uncharacterized protein LOC124167805 [Ischnura elegans]|uniref:uncharacterized protein LOC124167805 n=1 Tax=Ischnura elegans TaxID=197161 RepID=UPI001ED8B60A|nr:uncharacterized protein LOC124167805 [Ischnura elegans]